MVDLVRSVLALALLSAVVTSAAAAAPATPAASSAVSLTRIYRGEDGSALYTRQVGSTLYGFGEHPGRGLAFVFRGTVEAPAVKNVSWWDVPKGGTRRTRGTMELRWSQDGARLVRITAGSGLPAIWQAVSPGGFPWPNRLVAGFQGRSQSDLSGAFYGPGMRLYVTESTTATNEVVGVAERISQPGERPGFVSVFVGLRNGNVVTGSWANLAKGVSATAQGSFSFRVEADRRLRSSGLAGRRGLLEPDYALDYDAFRQAMTARLGGGNSVGWSFAMAQNGTVVVREAGGFRRTRADGVAKAFTPKTKSQAASTSKTLSAAALMLVLHERGVSVDAKVAPYLPSCVKPKPLMRQLTFRDLLAHRTGFLDSNQSCRADPFACLVAALEGRQSRTPTGYQNINYTLLRALVPLVDSPSATRKVFEDDGCKNTSNVINVRISQHFYFRLQKMLRPHEIDFAFYVGGNADYACNYDTRDRSVKGTCPRGDFALRAGAGYIAISAVDFVRFLSALDRGLIVPKALADMMKSGRLGFDGAQAGAVGSYVWKNGGCPGSSTGAGCSALAMIIPGNVQVYAMTNSGRNGAGATSTTLDDTIQAAFDAALK